MARRHRARRTTRAPGAGRRGPGTPTCCRCRRGPGSTSRTRCGRPGRSRPWRPRRQPARRRGRARRRPRRRGRRRCAIPRWRRGRRPAGAGRPGTSRWRCRTGDGRRRSRGPAPSHPAMTPTRSAQAVARPSAVTRARSSSVSVRVWPATAATSSLRSTGTVGRVRSSTDSPGASGTSPNDQPSPAGSRTSAVDAPRASTATAPSGDRPVGDPGEVPEPGGERDRLGLVGGGRTGEATQLGGEGRAEERCLDEPAAERLGDDRHLDARCQRLVAAVGGPQLAPPGVDDGGLDAVEPRLVVQLADRGRAVALGDAHDRVAQRLLLGGQSDVHQAPCSFVGIVPTSSSRSVRRRTLPDGSRGTSSTTTTRRRCL